MSECRKWATDPGSYSSIAHLYTIKGKVAWSKCGLRNVLAETLRDDAKDTIMRCAKCAQKP